MRSRVLSSIGLAAVMSFGTCYAAAAPVWVGDMETGDLSQWSYLLNAEVDGVPSAQVTGDPVFAGGCR